MRKLCFLAVLGLAATVAQAQHSDVEIVVENGALAVEPSAEGLFAFEGDLGVFPFPANVGEQPGFEADPGVFNPGDSLAFNVVTNLLYWNGAAFAAVPGGHDMSISNIVESVSVGAASGPQAGFEIGVADAGGGLHEDLTFTLNGPGAPDGLTIGAYGLWLALSSPQYDASNEFIILLNYGLGEDEFEAGVQAAGALVPEPATAALLAALAAALMSRRRA